LLDSKTAAATRSTYQKKKSDEALLKNLADQNNVTLKYTVTVVDEVMV
jgi:hypothetical protein